ncbi:hypothetical protein HYC85_028406 [Camellia sinensis]|uniref:Uncharacterized protein n=1 Tax=Camellia sinensis TaxID=4442 RepID=A0A7J7FV68_CAMSI|nr:hypothetical protein HYC85_028406 [Camellia sinensis]
MMQLIQKRASWADPRFLHHSTVTELAGVLAKISNEERESPSGPSDDQVRREEIDSV